MLYEVITSSTRVKDVDVEDVAFQKYCCTQAGLEIRNCYLVHINTDYVRRGEIEPEKLFENESIDERVLEGVHPLAGAKVANLSPALAEELELDDTWDRITSYNVCYTKLLRASKPSLSRSS